MENSVAYQGLTSNEVAERLSKYGLNEIPEPRRWRVFSAFLSQFDNFLTLLLVFAAIVSFFLGEQLDALFISLIIILNAFFGLYQEFKAEHALASLKKLTVTAVRVIRDGMEQEIDSRLLVPGDIIYLEEGSKIPADAKLLSALHFEVNEASLTGESLPVEKNPDSPDGNRLFMGTIVARGRGYAQITAIGAATRFGKIAQTLETIEKVKTPLTRKLEVFTKHIGILGMLAAGSVFVLSFVQEKTLLESFIFAVSLAVAAVPEGLPAVMTITLALGVERMARQQAIVRKLNAIEALGSVTVVATDKTGTLTTNKMRVKKIWLEGKTYDTTRPPTLRNYAFHTLIVNGVICSTATLTVTADGSQEAEVIGDPTEGAVLFLAEKLGLSPAALRQEWMVRDELSFNPVTKRMTVVVSRGRESYVFTKGAPESILAISQRILVGKRLRTLSEAQRSRIEQEFQAFAKKGLRMIAFSYKKEVGENIEKDHIFIGFVGMADPVRPEVAEAVKKARSAGIRVVMITGDNELTAEAVGVEIGIIQKGEEIVSGKQLDTLSDEELTAILPRVKIFARTTPDHKYRLVKLYQKLGEIVAVTGDGVNDALALKQADVGVAMGITGTDVAKETADMVVTDDNFASLINAIEEGRHIFNQIKNTIKYLLSCNLGEIIYILSAVVLRLPVLTPLQILYMNIATDGLPAISLAFSPRDPRAMRDKPRRQMSILEQRDFVYLGAIGLATALLGYLTISPLSGILAADWADKTTIVFTTIMLVQHFVLTDLWVSHKSVIRNIHLVAKPIFLAAFFLPVLFHPLLLYHPVLSAVFKTTPLTWQQLAFSVGVASLMLVGLELAKFFKKPHRP